MNSQLRCNFLSSETVKQGGGEKGVQRHLKQGKLLVRDRLSKLLDNADDFLELSAVAGIGMPYGDVPSAGVVLGTYAPDFNDYIACFKLTL